MGIKISWNRLALKVVWCGGVVYEGVRCGDGMVCGI